MSIEKMTYKEFTSFCNERACDGRWNLEHAIAFTDIIRRVNKHRFWRREREWQKINSEFNISKEIRKIKSLLKQMEEMQNNI